MKTTTITTIAALLLGSSSLFAAEAFTKPSGFVTHTLKAGQFNLIGLTLHESVAVSGTLTGVSTTTLTDTNVDFDATLANTSTYILEITSGALSGTLQEVSQWGTPDVNSLTTPNDLTAGVDTVVVGDAYQVRQAATLEDVFGTTDSVLQKGVISTLADIVWIPDGLGGYGRYFLSTTNLWKNASNNALAPNVPLVYVDAIFIQRKGADVDLVITGVVKSNSSAVVLTTGFNPVSVVAPVGSTLQNSGLSDSLTAGAIATLADIVWVADGSGGYDRYYYHSTNVWRNATTNANVAVDVVLPSGIFVQRKGAATEVVLTPPAGYSGL